jgi:hypothetical protein
MSATTASKTGPQTPVRSAAVRGACQRIEQLLSKSPAYKKVDDALFVIKQGSTLVMLSVHSWRQTHAVVRLVAQLVKGVSMEVPLALELLEINAVLRFGAFAYVPAGDVILFCHTMADRELTDEDEFMETIRDFAVVADEYDDRIAARYGGQTMEELLEESVVEHVRGPQDRHPLFKP